VNSYVYLYFHSDDLDSVIEELKKAGVDLKLKFEKYRYTEILAANEDLVLGKYKNVAFIISKKQIEITCDCLKKVTVEIAPADETFNEFKFGKFKIEDEDLTKIKLDTEFDKELFYDLIPALQIELIKADILLKECNLQAEVLSRKESEIIREVSKLSERAKKSSDVSELETILSEVSTHHVDFFRKFMRFKDVNEEMFSSITEFEVISRNLGNWFSEKADELKDFHERLIYFESKFEQTLNGIRDLFTLVSLRLDMLRNREYLDLQRRTASLQAAAAVIEFVAVFYYTLKIWEYFMPIERMPAYISFTLLSIFTTSVVAFTEVFGELIRERKVSNRFVILAAILLVALLLMYYIPNLFSEA